MKVSDIRLTGRTTFVLIFFAISFAPSIVLAQDEFNVSNDWKVTSVGLVRQIINNRWRFHSNNTDYTGLIDCEYPPGSGEEHTGPAEAWLGGITPDGDTLVSAGASIGPDEFWPSAAPWDTIWVVDRGEKPVDIGGPTEDGGERIYKPNYTAVSDQDFVSSFSDFNILDPSVGGDPTEPHRPLYVEVIETVFSWGSPPMDDVLVWTWEIIPTEFDITDAYFSFRTRSAIGNPFEDPGEDDRTLYYPKYHLLAFEDGPGGQDGDAIGSLGYMMIPPPETKPAELDWTFLWGSPVHQTDAERYRTISSGEIMQNQQLYVGNSGGYHSYIAFGPMQLTEGDTTVIRMVELLGEGLDGVLENADVAQRIADKNFRLPAPPPAPRVDINPGNKKVTLSWEPTEEYNPEEYTDDNRGDEVEKPFEGYRVYKSTQSESGPWTLLSEYDIADNSYGQNAGLRHRYVDRGLLNNVTYYYSVTAFSKRDTTLPWPSTESSVYQSSREVIPGTRVPDTVGEVVVVPNPYRGDVDYTGFNPPWETSPSGRGWMEQDRRLQFINLPPKCTIKIYSAAGDYINTIDHNNPNRGTESWNMTSYVNQAIASGVYLFVVEDLTSGETQVGKFVVIK